MRFLYATALSLAVGLVASSSVAAKVASAELTGIMSERAGVVAPTRSNHNPTFRGGPVMAGSHSTRPQNQIRDLSGQRFGKLVVVRFVSRNKQRHHWLCKCDCGNEAVVCSQDMKAGDAASCGCLHKQKAKERLVARITTHGLSETAEHRTWLRMKARCTNHRKKGYHLYGGRGITVCDRWVGSFENFVADMGQKPAGCTLDRIDVNGNYEPGNCRWATPLQQARNKRATHWVTYLGEKLSLPEWAERLGVPAGRLKNRLARGWSVERAFTEGVQS